MTDTVYCSIIVRDGKMCQNMHSKNMCQIIKSPVCSRVLGAKLKTEQTDPSF